MMWIAGLAWSSNLAIAQDFDEVAKYHIDRCQRKGANLVTLVPDTILSLTFVYISN
jgi:hypothetical protein